MLCPNCFQEFPKIFTYYALQCFHHTCILLLSLQHFLQLSWNIYTVNVLLLTCNCKIDNIVIITQLLHCHLATVFHENVHNLVNCLSEKLGMVAPHEGGVDLEFDAGSLLLSSGDDIVMNGLNLDPAMIDHSGI